jgi:hypothetical protein
VPRSFVGASIRAVIKGIYVVLFRWWLEPLLTRQAERSLMRDVKRDLAFLFARFGAQFVPNERKYKWGKVVTLAAGNVKIRASLDRGEYGVALSPNTEPSEWTGIRDLLTAIVPDYVRPPYDPLSLYEWGKLLEPYFLRIEEAYQPENYAVTSRNLEKVRADAIAKMKAEVEVLHRERRTLKS